MPIKFFFSIIKTLLNKISKNPKNIFLIDGLGAFLTAFFLFVIIAQFEDSFGMPREICIYLSLLAILFCVYSFTCFLIKTKKWKSFLKIIIVANIFYCLVTLFLCFFFYHSLTLLGLTYFFLEILIIGVLVWLEYRLLSLT